MSEENVEIVRRGFAALLRDAPLTRDNVEERLSDDALAEFFRPDVEWVIAPQSPLAGGGGSYRGYEGVRRFWADLLSAWDDFTVEFEGVLEAGEQVVVIARMDARVHELEINELWSALLTLREGKVARLQSFTNRDAALEAAGLSE